MFDTLAQNLSNPVHAGGLFTVVVILSIIVAYQAILLNKQGN